MRQGLQDIPVFYSELMLAETDSLSPSASKPRHVLAAWQKAGLPIAVHPFAPVSELDLCLAHDAIYVRGIVENCGNTLILRCSVSEQGGTAQFASRLIGQREVVHITQSRTRRPSDFLASTTTSEHRTIEPAVMASEIERLPDLEGFLKFASIPDWTRVTLVHRSYPSIVRNRRQDSATTTPESEIAPPLVASKPSAQPAAPPSEVK